MKFVTGTLLSSLCQMLIKSSWLYSGSGVGSLTRRPCSQGEKYAYIQCIGTSDLSCVPL